MCSTLPCGSNGGVHAHRMDIGKQSKIIIGNFVQVKTRYVKYKWTEGEGNTLNEIRWDEGMGEAICCATLPHKHITMLNN